MIYPKSDHIHDTEERVRHHGLNDKGCCASVRLGDFTPEGLLHALRYPEDATADEDSAREVECNDDG